jgi:hydrogenase maturation protease
MRTLLLACGNPLRGDDGAAHEALRLIPPTPHHAAKAVQQLTPELAAEIARFSRVVFLDADAAAEELIIEPLRATMPRSPFTHAATPEEIVALAGALFGFTGTAFVCRIPAGDFTAGESLGPGVLHLARDAARKVSDLI